ncbi:hypothetical protein Tco_0668466, partial [Tanacetum coccineum]
DFYSGNAHRGYPGSPPIRYEESSGHDYVTGITMVLLPSGFLKPLYPCIMNMINDQDIEHMIPLTPPKDTEPPIGSPIPSSLSSSVGSSSPVRMASKRTSTTAAPTMTQAAIRKIVAASVAAALEAQAATMANTDKEKLL